MHVACAAEGEYVKHSAAMLHSVLEHCGRAPLVVHFLHGPRLPTDVASALREMVERRGATLALHEVPDSWVDGLPVDRYTPAMWYRVFLPELAPAVDRVLYLDVDTIVVGSLRRL